MFKGQHDPQRSDKGDSIFKLNLQLRVFLLTFFMLPKQPGPIWVTHLNSLTLLSRLYREPLQHL